MGAKADIERERTEHQRRRADLNFEKLRETRVAFDRLKVEAAATIEQLETENESLREMVQTVTRGGIGAVL